MPQLGSSADEVIEQTASESEQPTADKSGTI
jgi:hypothetical protein